jgi:hypothetical protein
MPEPIRDFDGIAKACLVLGAIFLLLGFSGLYGHDLAVDLRELQASTGVSLPSWFPTPLIEHYRLLCALQLPPNALMAVAGWGLLRKAAWGIGALKLSAWVFLVGTAAFGIWAVEAIGPATAPQDAADQALRTTLIWTLSMATVAMECSIAWFLWRMRGARFA